MQGKRTIRQRKVASPRKRSLQKIGTPYLAGKCKSWAAGRESDRRIWRKGSALMKI